MYIQLGYSRWPFGYYLGCNSTEAVCGLDEPWDLKSKLHSTKDTLRSRYQ